MATADTPISTPSPKHDTVHHHDYDNHQDPAFPAMALRFPTYCIETTCHDAKTGSHRRPRRWVAQVFTNAYYDILHTWMGLHRSFSHPAAARPHTQPRQYDTFTYGDSSSDSDSCVTTDAGAFSAAVGDMILEPPINLLLICVPLGVAAYHASPVATPSVVFAINALAIVPLSSLLTDATERIALEAGDAVGAFLNISLGNIVELILFVVTLINGHVRIVQASILGSILVNLLPILGSALIAAHTTSSDDSLDSTETQMLACLLSVSVFVFMIPTAFRFTFSQAPNINDIVVHMSRFSAVLILVVYTAYFLHTMQSSHHHADDDGGELGQPPVTPPPLLSRRESSPPLTPGPRTLRFADGAKTQPTSDLYARRVFEIGPASIDSDGPPEEELPPRGRSLTGTRGPNSAHTVSSPLLLLPSHMRRYQSRSLSTNGSSRSRASSWMSRGRPIPCSFARAGLARVLSNDRRRRTETVSSVSIDDEATSNGRLSAMLAAVTVLLVASLLLAVSARLLAGTLDAVTRQQQGRLSAALVGVVLLPLAGNLSSYLTVVAVAARDNLDLAVAVSAGSAIQVALCVAPLTVLAGWALGQPVVLALDGFEMAMLLGAASLVNLLVLSGGGGDKLRPTGLKGGILCACFLVMGIATSFAPNSK